MADSDPLSLEQRVARLERLVARLLEQDDGSGAATKERSARPKDERTWSWSRPESAGGPASGGAAGEATAGFSGAAAAAGAAPGPGTRGPSSGLADHGERWLGRVGVAFVVLAFGFLFRYAFDQGWIGPAMRVVLGLVVGTAMLVIGLRLEGARERYSQYLLGGAVAVYYVVGFASYQLYGLWPFAVAFAFMSAVTVLAFVLAERQRLPSLAVIGAAGGLSTPFVVSTGSGNVPALVAYATLLLAGAGALQLLRGWRSLLLTLGFGGLAVMALAVGMAEGPSDLVEAGVVTIGILAAWVLFGALPLFRAHFHRLDPETWPEPELPDSTRRIATPAQITMSLLRVGCIVAALVVVLELGALFELERATFGWLYLLGFFVYVVLARAVFETRIALNPAAETAALVLTFGIALVFLDYRVMLPLAVAGAGMHMAHQRWGLPGVAVLAHLVFAQLMLMTVGRLEVLGVAAGSPFGVRELGALAAIVLALTTSFTFGSALVKQVYRIAAHVAFLIWLATQLGSMEYGQELVSLSWGIYGIALLLLSMRLRHRGVQLAGLATLGLVAAKLLLVDMAQVDVVWRILLFMGFGAAFLGLSYLINRESTAD
jgi:uncharacterized membrane protein